MTILYFANLQNLIYPFKDIKKALSKLNHKVLVVNDQDFEMKDIIKKANESDVFLFHHGGVDTGSETNLQLSVARLQTILSSIKCKKVLWFVDKVWGASEIMVERIVPMVHCAFFNDDTWVREHNYFNVYPLHCGVGEKRPLGKFRKEYECDIAFIGKAYGTRVVFFENLRQQFGRKFKLFENVYDNNFDDLCRSAKVIIAPKFPDDDFYWSDRIYRVLGAGGLLLQPRLYGLQKEGFKTGKHFVSYFTWNEVMFHLKYLLTPEYDKKREKISQAGREFVHSNFSYEQRLKEIFKKL